MTDTDSAPQEPQTLESVGLVVTQSMTTPKKRGKQPRPVWLVTGRVNPYRQFLYDLGGITRFTGRNTFSFFEDPTDAILEAIRDHGAASFREQQEAQRDREAERASRLSERAKKHAAKGAQAKAAFDAIHEHIPLGQPILVGHHSEKRHRRDLDRANAAGDRWLQETNYAKDLAGRAAVLEAKADGSKITREFVGNRIKDCQAQLEALKRRMGTDSEGPDPEGLQFEISDTEEALEYWLEKLQELGQPYTPETIRKGGWIQYRNGSWYEVVRVSKKSATIKGWMGVPDMTWRAMYHYITGYWTPEQVAQAKLKQEIKQQADTQISEGPQQQ